MFRAEIKRKSEFKILNAEMKKAIIAIDGPAASGKSTTARLLAKRLGYIYIDTGAMYRAVTLAVLQAGIDPHDTDAVAEKAAACKIELKIVDGVQHTFLNGVDVSARIRTPQIDQAISAIATNPRVREQMVTQQRALASAGGVVMDGRDIGTVVLPHADLKVFMNASLEARARRRLKEQGATDKNLTLAAIREDIRKRDHADRTRRDGPLLRAKDAHLLDNSHMTIDEQVEKILSWL